MIARAPSIRPSMLALYAGALMACAAHGLALASPPEHPLPPIRPAHPLPSSAPPAAAPIEDALGADGFYVEANELVQDDADHKVTARGGVEARYQGRVIRADEIIYDTVSGVVQATGDVVVVNPDGSVDYSEKALVQKGGEVGVSTGFASRLPGGVLVAGATAVRQSALKNELNEAVYTPCPICAKNPTPTWSIRARKAVEDKKRQIIYFRDAVLLIRGVPILYLPVFWHADPSVKRKSGFLEPEINRSSIRGFSWEQPYLQVISPSEDLVISPQINSKVNPFLNVDWRKRFYPGAIDVRAGYTYDQNFDASGHKFGPELSHAYVLAKGLFAIDENWSWGFTAERVSDPLIFDKYGILSPFAERGLYVADDRRLTSQVYAIRQDQASYLSIAAVSIQGLRSTDIQSTIPTVAPLIEAHYEPDQPIFGGRLRFSGSGVILNQDESLTNPGLAGTDSRRGTVEADWRRTYFLSDGVRLDPFVNVRGDVYSLRNLAPPYSGDATITRGMPTAGLDISWPLYRRMGVATVILEPIAQIALSPAFKQDPRIPNEDSEIFEFDDVNLFTVNKAPGFDLYEGGQRLNVGERATVELDDGRDMSVLLGRSFRAEPDPNLPVRTGLTTTASDWVIGADGSPIEHLELFSHVRLGAGDFSIRRLELGANYRIPRIWGQVRYLREAEDSTGVPVNDLDFNGGVLVTKNWGVTFLGTRDFITQTWTQRDFGLVYQNDCLRVEILYRRDYTYNRTLGPSGGFGIRLTLATLGNSGYSPSSPIPPP